jgi:plastocyanin
MRRLALLALALALAGSAVAAAAVARRSSTAVGIGEREWRIAVYRPSVPRGVVRFNITNRGEDDHNLAVFDARGRRLARSPTVAPDGHRTLRVRLSRAGTYRLVCTLGNHAALGMRARIRVRG